MYVLRKAIYKLLKINNLLMDNEQFVLKMSNIGDCDVVQWQKLRSMENWMNYASTHLESNVTSITIQLLIYNSCTGFIMAIPITCSHT